MDIFGLNDINCILDARLDVLQFKVGIVVADNDFEGNGFPDQLQNSLHRDARASHARFPKVDVGADFNSTHQDR